MKYIFLGGYYPIEFRDDFRKNSKRGYQMAANVFQESLLDGFYQNGIDLSIISFPFLSSYPFGYKNPIVRGGTFSYKDKFQGFVTSFFNVPFLRFKINNLEELIKSYLLVDEDVTLLVYSVQVHFLKQVVRIKNKYPKVKVCLIVPDLPEFMGCNSIYEKLGLKKRDLDYIYKSIDKVDSFVFLTDSMAKHFKVQDKPWIRVEGIYTPKLSLENVDKEDKVILYAGALLEKYGIKTLIDAFRIIEDKNYKLWICGDGSYRDTILDICKTDKRIIFKGLVTHDEVLLLQRKASLLVNPRTPDGEYTKYSFPSKTMEYIASGTPTLMYKLPAMPDEYIPYFFQIESNSTPGRLAEQIQTICGMDSQEIRTFGVKASTFIKNEKNSKIQTLKIINMLRDIS